MKSCATAIGSYRNGEMNSFWSQQRMVELIFFISIQHLISIFLSPPPPLSLALALFLPCTVAALNWKWPVDCNERFDETTAKSTDTKGVDYGHAITNVTPLEMIRIGCATAPMTSPRSSMEHHRLIFAEQFGQTLTRFMQYQSIFMSSSPTFKTVVYEQLRATVEAVIDRWNSCSSAMMPLIERNQNEPYYRKRKSITVRNLFVPLMYIYLFRWNIYRNANINSCISIHIEESSLKFDFDV